MEKLHVVKMMKQRFKNMPIRNKFTAVCISIMLALVVLILVISNVILYNSDIKKTKEIAQDECEIIKVRLNSMRDNMIICTNMLTQDINRIYRDTNIRNINDVSFVSIKKNINAALDYDKRSFADIHSILFVDARRNMVSVGLTSNPDYKTVKEELLSQIADFGLAKNVQFPIKYRTCFSLDEPILTFGKRIISMDTGEIIGYIFINIKESTISSIFPGTKGEVFKRSYYLVDESGIIRSSSEKSALLKGIQEKNLLEYVKEFKDDSKKLFIQREAYLVTKKPVTVLSFNLVSQISIRDLTQNIRTTSKIIIILGITGIIIAVVLIFIMSNFITTPIHILTDAAEKIQEGDFTVHCESNTEDEVGILSRAFNTMTVKIDKLLNQIKAEQKRKREYELALIQAQVKPHFLYNTLDLIYVLCESGMPKEGAKVTKSLADYYRTSLSNGNEIISIGEEIKNIENYLYIQRERYCDLIEFEIKSDKKAENYSILKMTLQPIVENAIYHGLKEKGSKGKILVTVNMEESAILLSVEDDGVGMSTERMDEVLKENKQEYKQHFGLRSVDERIKLYYGESFGIRTQSTSGKGTKVFIRIPKKMEDEL